MARYNSTINATLAAGETERWVVPTPDDDAVRVDLSADGQPYDVDIATAPTHEPQSDFDAADYTSCLPLGPETYTDTNEHTTATDVVDASVYVEITNNSGGPATFTGSIDTHSKSASDSAAEFATRGTGERASAYRDGKALGNAESYNAEQLLNEISDAKVQSAWDGLVVPVSGGLGMSDAIDPAATSTPVQDAIDTINNDGNGGGAILMPPEEVTGPGGWTDLGRIDVIGMNHNKSSYRRTDPSNAILQDNNNRQYSNLLIDRMKFDGNNDAGPGFMFLETKHEGLNLGDVKMVNFDTRGESTPGVIAAPSGVDAAIFHAHWRRVDFENNTGPAMNWLGGGGPALSIGTIDIKGSSTQDTQLVLQASPEMIVGGINIGGDCNKAIESNSTLVVGTIHFELNNVGATRLVDFRGFTTIQHTTVFGSATFDYIYGQMYLARGFIGPIKFGGSVTINNNLIKLNNQPTQVTYTGPVSDVDTNGQTGEGFYCISSQRFADALASPFNPEIFDLGGSDQVLSPSAKAKPEYTIQMRNTGGSVAAIQGIDNIARQGQRVVITAHDVTNNITLAHNAAVTNPLLNQSGTNDTLDAVGEQAVYVYDGDAWRQQGINQQ